MAIEYIKSDAKKKRIAMAFKLLDEGRLEEAGHYFDRGLPETPVQRGLYTYVGGVAEYKTIDEIPLWKTTLIKDLKRGTYYPTFESAGNAYNKDFSFAQYHKEMFKVVKVNWIISYKGVTGDIHEVQQKLGIAYQTLQRYHQRKQEGYRLIRAEVEK